MSIGCAYAIAAGISATDHHHVFPGGHQLSRHFVARNDLVLLRKKFHGEISEGILGGEKVLVLKPQTFMNESGRAVGEALRFHDVPLDHVLVFYDELDLEPGKVRVKLGGGAAGHNGIRSISAHITLDYKRGRLGIGHPGDKNLVLPHVLGDFAKQDRDWLVTMLDGVADNAEMLARGEDAPFQSKVHLAVNPPPPKPPRKVD